MANQRSFKDGNIAVIIPCYNYGYFLAEAIESVLCQTRPPDEILITDDCSTDITMEIALEYQKKYPNLIKYNRNETNLGLVENFNKGVSLTNSNHISFLSADDRFRSDYIDKVSEVLVSDCNIGIAYTDLLLFGERAKMVYDEFPNEWKGPMIKNCHYIIHFPDFDSRAKILLEKQNFIHGSSMFTRNAFYEVGGFVEKKGIPVDHNFFLRITKKGWLARRVPHPILEYRQHSRSQARIIIGLNGELNFYKERVKKLEVELNNIYNSNGWKFLLKYYQIRDRVISEARARWRLAKLFLNILGNYKG
jgi:glycosyltransferase involved in cell wall biosynthesis